MATGHVRKRGKKWAYVHYVLDPSTGENKYRWKGGFRTKGDADRALREAMSSVDHHTFTEPSKINYRDYIERTWIPQLEGQLESSTIESYQRNMRVHILPKLGGLKIQKLGPTHLNNLYRDLQKHTIVPNRANRRHNPKIYERIAYLRKHNTTYREIAERLTEEFPDEPPLTKDSVRSIVKRSKKRTQDQGVLSVRTVRYIHTIISRSLKDALKLGLVVDNAARNASPPRKPKAKPSRELWTADQTKSFLRWAHSIDHSLAVAWAFIATSGDRRGANLGLRWQDIDFDRGTAALIWKVTCVNHKLVVKPYGKSGENHEIIIDHGTLAMLRSWRARQNQLRLALGLSHECATPEPQCEDEGYHVRDLVFARPDGNYLHPERFSREFRRAQERYNRAHPEDPLPKISLHALRHGWATVALEAGIAMKVVQDRLNHASERITADIYTHVRAPLQSDAAERVAELILPEGM